MINIIINVGQLNWPDERFDFPKWEQHNHNDW